MLRDEERARVRGAIAEFPVEFGLRDPRVRGKRFRIEESASYVSAAYGILLYTYIWDEASERWLAYAKGSPEELRREIIPC